MNSGRVTPSARAAASMRSMSSTENLISIRLPIGGLPGPLVLVDPMLLIYTVGYRLPHSLVA